MNTSNPCGQQTNIGVGQFESTEVIYERQLIKSDG